MTKKKEPLIVVKWGKNYDTKGKLISPLMQRALSNKVKPLLYDHQGLGNFFTYRAAIGVLGMRWDEVYDQGRYSETDPKKYADFGYMTCHIGPSQKALDAMRENVTFENIKNYPPDLIAPLRDAAAEIKFRRPRDESFDVLGVEGAQGGIGYTYLTYLDPGDEVIVTDPGYFHFAPGCNLSGAIPRRIVLRKENNYRLDPDEVKKAINLRTKMIVICDPINPFGTIQTKDELIEICNICRENNILIFNNVTHNTHQLDDNETQYPIASLYKECDVDHVISVSGTTKGYGLASIRLGFLGAHPDILKGVALMKMEITKIHTNLVGQYGALAALQDHDHVIKSQNIIRENLKHIVETVEKTEGCTIPVMPKYGFSMAIDISETGVSAQELCVALFKRKVIVTPGDGLGESGALTLIRLNISRPDKWAYETFREALPEAIKEAQTGIYAEPVAKVLEDAGTERGARMAAAIRERVRRKRIG